MHRVLKLALVAVVAIGCLVAPAVAHQQTNWDPDDADSPLDLRRVAFAHTENRIEVTAEIRRPLRRWMVGNRDRADSIYFHFDTQDNNREVPSDFYVEIVTTDRGYRAVVRKFDHGWPRVGSAELSRPASDTVVINVSKNLIRANGRIGWNVVTSYDFNSDRSGWLRHGV